MDDFLHNLRSGKLKQSDRGRRDYPDYKGPQRRTGSDRRRTDYYAKVTNENFALIKEVLDTLAGNQKRIADATAAGIKAEARIADALEAITVLLQRHWGYEDVLPSRAQTGDDDMQPNVAKNDRVASEAITEGSTADSSEDGEEQKTPELLDIIETMRTEGSSWEKIARYFDEQNFPTVSGKGKWRGPAVKKFWDTNFGAAGT